MYKPTSLFNRDYANANEQMAPSSRTFHQASSSAARETQMKFIKSPSTEELRKLKQSMVNKDKEGFSNC